MIHDLKIWPDYFDSIDRGEKTFELRKNDRGFNINDTLCLREWNPVVKNYTGRQLNVKVTYICSNTVFGLQPGYVCMAVKKEYRQHENQDVLCF